jgi:hypothetical protein
MDETEDVAVDVNTEVEETTDSNESSYENTTAKDAEIERLRKANTQILARAKKAEDALKSKAPHITNDPQLTDELKLIARGLSDEEIEQAKVIAKGTGKTLQEAIKEPLFLTYQSNLKEEQAKERAKLGASKGSGESEDATLIKPGMSREEHEEAFKQVMGS